MRQKSGPEKVPATQSIRRATRRLEAGKRRLAGDTARAATSDEVKDLRREASALKEVVAELTLENRLLKKKRDGGWGGRRMRYQARSGRRASPGAASSRRAVLAGAHEPS
jgi:hypothetical protein